MKRNFLLLALPMILVAGNTLASGSTIQKSYEDGGRVRIVRTRTSSSTGLKTKAIELRQINRNELPDAIRQTENSLTRSAETLALEEAQVVEAAAKIEAFNQKLGTSYPDGSIPVKELSQVLSERDALIETKHAADSNLRDTQLFRARMQGRLALYRNMLNPKQKSIHTVTYDRSGNVLTISAQTSKSK